MGFKSNSKQKESSLKLYYSAILPRGQSDLRGPYTGGINLAHNEKKIL